MSTINKEFTCCRHVKNKQRNIHSLKKQRKKDVNNNQNKNNKRRLLMPTTNKETYMREIGKEINNIKIFL